MYFIVTLAGSTPASVPLPHATVDHNFAIGYIADCRVQRCQSALSETTVAGWLPRLWRLAVIWYRATSYCLNMS